VQLYSFRMREVAGAVGAVRDDLDIDPDTVHVGKAVAAESLR
jgi:hypothetical protein